MNTAVAVLLAVFLRRTYQGALTSVEEKNAGLIAYYRQRVVDIFQRRLSLVSILAGLHFLSLHLLVPLWGFAIFLRSDGNFLVIVLSIIASIQLVQRLFPSESAGDFH
ncbi:MAG: hypothetical protein HY042_00105 [Spirochaetia bacterium]|nr:hypothetical protein [Spirochaetia bacterium]